MKLVRFIPLFLSCVGLYAAPVITSIQNPASNILPGLPNFGIAQGQIFVLYGTGMGPATLAQATALPLATTLGGTTVKLTPPGGGTSVNAPIIYVLDKQIAAVLPSNFPLTAGGALATVQVTYNGSVGNNFSLRVVDSNFGISTVDQTGGGAAVITDANYKLITSNNAAVPGSTYTMWGTALGPTDSDNNIPSKGTFPNVHVFVGGVEANVPYAGISGGVGLNQINFTIPQGVTGCYVSLIVQSDTTPARVSNGTTIPIAAGGGTCVDSNSYSNAAVNAVLAAKGSVSAGVVSLEGSDKQVFGLFLKFNPAQWAAAGNIFDTVSLGSCVTKMQIGNGGGDDFPPPSTGLDAGTALTLTPPTGAAITLPSVLPGIYLSTSLPGVTSGSYKISNGAGGKDVGAFSVSFNGPPAFAWTNSTITTVPRTQGLKINWSGGDNNSFVDINGYAGGNPITVNGQTVASNVGTQFECQVPASTGTFTVPPSVLLAMSAAPTGVTANGSIQLTLQANPTVLTIPGVDFGFATSSTAVTATNVAFQ